MTGTAPSIRLVPYLRVSTDDKGQDPERQLDLIKSWAARENIVLGNVFRDVGVSGDSDPLERQGFKDAMEEASDKGFSGLVVEAPDRLTRGGVPAFWVASWRLENEHKLKVYAADQGFAEQSSMAGVLFSTIKAAMAKEWLDRHRKAVKSGMERARRNGSYIGRKPKPFSADEEIFIRGQLAVPALVPHRNKQGLTKNPDRLGWKAIAHEVNKRRGVFDIVDSNARKRKAISPMTIRRLARVWAGKSPGTGTIISVDTSIINQ